MMILPIRERSAIELGDGGLARAELEQIRKRIKLISGRFSYSSLERPRACC